MKKQSTAQTCQICGRRLTDAQSIALGFGPDCAAKRSNILSGMGVTEEDLIAWQQEPAAQRWVNFAFQALRKGRMRDVRTFFEAARRALPKPPSTLTAVAPTPIGLGQPADLVSAQPSAKATPAPRLSLAGFEQAAEDALAVMRKQNRQTEIIWGIVQRLTEARRMRYGELAGKTAEKVRLAVLAFRVAENGKAVVAFNSPVHAYYSQAQWLESSVIVRIQRRFKLVCPSGVPLLVTDYFCHGNRKTEAQAVAWLGSAYEQLAREFAATRPTWAAQAAEAAEKIKRVYALQQKAA